MAKSKSKITKLEETVNAPYMMAQKIIEQEARNAKRAEQQSMAFNKYVIENFNYSPTLSDFKQKASIEKRRGVDSYLFFLRECLENYGNSAYYHIQWTDSDIGNYHKEISAFCSNEINLILISEESSTLQNKAIVGNNSSFSTKHLENVLRLIGYWISGNEAVIGELLNPGLDEIEDFLDPFAKELNKNLLLKESSQGKKDLIKFYVFEFNWAKAYFNQYRNILFNSTISNYDHKKYISQTGNDKVRLNKLENYAVESQRLFDMAFTELQICCFKYQIDFFKICHELDFPTDIFDGGMSLLNEEIMYARPPLEINEVHYNPTSQVQTTKTKSDQVRVELTKHKFDTYLSDKKKFNSNQIEKAYNYLLENEIPQKIALLKVIGYIDYFTQEFCNGKTSERDKLLATVLMSTTRRIKGNINVLNSNSAENRSLYTSHKYKEEAKEILRNL